jgi:hypothetical protein
MLQNRQQFVVWFEFSNDIGSIQFAASLKQDGAIYWTHTDNASVGAAGIQFVCPVCVGFATNRGSFCFLGEVMDKPVSNTMEAGSRAKWSDRIHPVTALCFRLAFKVVPSLRPKFACIPYRNRDDYVFAPSTL